MAFGLIEFVCSFAISNRPQCPPLEKFGLGAFELKLFRLENIEGKAENFAIVTKTQLEMELPFLPGSAKSELNGMYFVSSLCLESCRASERGLTT